MTVRFGKTFKVMEVDQAEPKRALRWRCVDSHIDAPGVLSRTDEWKGTTIAFDLSPDPAGTRLRLTHAGLTPQIECYDLCSAGWRQFLGSLKAYAETGTGTPFAG